MKPIAIICKNGTGSSLLANTFRACGMEIGNDNTYWHQAFDHHCEHSVLTHCWNRLLYGKPKYRQYDNDLLWRKWFNEIDSMNDLQVIAKIHEILHTYMVEAKKYNWSHFGVKITFNALESEVYNLWSIFRDIFVKEWPGCQFVTILRNPLDRIEYHNLDEQETINNWLKTVPMLKEIYEKGFVVSFSDSWNDQVKQIIEKIGLKWNEEAESLYDPTRIHKDKILYEKYPEVAEIYNNLKRAII